MTTVLQPVARSRRKAARAPAARHRVEEAYWGYVIRKVTPMTELMAALQVLATSGGILGLALTAGLWLMPMGGDSATLVAFRLIASVVLAGFGATLLWVGSRGTRAEVQIDIAQGEVREVLRNRAGLPTLAGRVAFADVGGVFLTRRPERGDQRATLVLRLGNSTRLIHVAQGPEDALLALRDRIGRDLMVRPRQSRPEPANAPGSPRPARLPPLAQPAA
ncbi:hypothetical protein [Pseudoroseicyclus sp. CXY001]|uniref:hypothetical protein n=1 Tax=Pseudoroseicyclus sp. CXY001 TaxID=3242492 RepID=UPI003570BA14